eukprot:GHVH01014169.1.p1 GENE.GHVH01014169.1~~GHVH01014169.1.p1  ORF type:complete len:471 (-),score=79.60 GHVH01014169.1:108-1520(-)
MTVPVKMEEPRQIASRGKHVLIVCCGVDLSKISIFRNIKSRLDIHLYCLEGPDNRMARELSDEGICEHIPCETFNDIRPHDPQFITSVMKDVEQAMQNYGLSRFDGVATIWDDAVGLCARIADRLDLPCNSIESIDIAHDKYLSRQRLAGRGLPCPANVLIKEENATDHEIRALTAHLKAPVIVKPGSAGSSIGVRKVECMDDIVEEYNVCLKVVRSALLDGELMGINMGDNAATAILIEEFLTGDEVDVDVVLNDGEIVYCQVMDDWPYRKPWYCELGCHFPSKHPDELRNKFIQAAREVVKTFGLTTSVHHLEFINDHARGPTLVEVNPRMGGGPVYNFHYGAFGIDLFEEVIMSCLGLSHIPPAAGYPKEGPAHAKASCVTMVAHARKTGAVMSDVKEALSIAEQDDDVALAAAMSRKGDWVTGWDDGFPTDMARIDVVSKTLSIDDCILKAQRLLDEFFANIQVTY